jgi:translation initiation factor IF-2
MSEEKRSLRVNKVLSELNIGLDTLVDFLRSKGSGDGLNINSKLDGDQYEHLLKQFAPDRAQKQKADQIKSNLKEFKTAKPDDLLSLDELTSLSTPISAEDLKSSMVEATAPAPTQEVVAPVAVAVAEPILEDIPEAPAKAEDRTDKLPGLKVLGKIDTSTLDRKPKPKAKAPVAPALPLFVEKAAEVHVAPVEEIVSQVEVDEVLSQTVQEFGPVAIPEELVTEEGTIRAADNAPKLSGLKIMGKMNLPDARAKTKPKPTDAPAKPLTAAEAAEEEAKRKRKRKRKESGVGSTPTVANDRLQNGARSVVARARGKEEPNSKEVSSNLRSTLADMRKGASRQRQKIRKDRRTERYERNQRAEYDREGDNLLEVNEYLTANELANLMELTVNEVIAKCMELGYMVSINQRLERDLISVIVEEFGFEPSFVSLEEALLEEDYEEDPETQVSRSPIVTVMGHVDHGKTTLLDFIRKSNVASREAGGITQHIGAYRVKLDDERSVTFLDTPGHEAFTAMRARGAQVTDIAIIVIAADDQVMPQTREAINHAQAAGVPMVIAINKIDKPGANAEKIREQLSTMGLLVEQWGGKVPCSEISAKNGTGIEDLLEKVWLEAEILELKADPDRPGRGTVIEAQLDKGRGVVATILVQTGTLRVGDVLVANANYGKVKAMFNQNLERIKEAGPSVPVQILGLDGTPQAGDKFTVMENEREGRELANKRGQLVREQNLRMKKHITLEEIARRSAVGDFRELNIIIKGDVDGSVEALADSLIKLSREEVAVNLIMKGVGQITESDVLLASASNAIVIGFQVRPSSGARKLAQQEQIDVRMYSIIYDAINEIRDALEGLLKPTIQEEIVGSADVRQVFKISKVGTIAGCMVTEGKFNRNDMVRLIRDGVVVFTGKLAALKRFKDDVKEVLQGFECGISIENFNDIREGDTIEAYKETEVKRTLS